MQGEIAKIEQIQRVHEASERCVLKRQRELWEKQHDAAEVAMHKRMEQQKMVLDLEKCRAHEYAQVMKKHALQKEKLRQMMSSSPRTATAEDEPILKITEHQGIPEEIAEDPCYKERVEASNLYENTLTRWNTFVQDNDRRAEIYRQKLLPEEKRKTFRERVHSKGQLFKKKVSDVAVVRKLLSKSTSVPAELDTLPLPGSAIEGDWNEEDFSSKYNSTVLLGSSVAYSERHADRMEQVRMHHEKQEAELKQKAAMFNNQFEDRRQKGKEKLKQKSSAAKGYNEAWKERNDDYAHHRQQQNSNNGEALAEKLANQRAEREAELEQRHQETVDMCEIKALRYEMTLDAGNQKIFQLTQELQNKCCERDQRKFDFKEARIANAKATVLAQDITGRIDEMIAKKSMSAKSFQRETNKAIHEKIKRNDHAKALITRPIKPQTPDEAFGRHRLLREHSQKSGARQRTPVAVPPPIADPEELEARRAVFYEELLDGSPEASPYQTPVASPKSYDADATPSKQLLARMPSMRRAERSATALSLASSPCSPSSTRPRDRLPTNTSMASMASLGAEPGPQHALSPRSTHSSRHEDSDDLEAEFLADLESSSRKWLTTLRQESS